MVLSAQKQNNMRHHKFEYQETFWLENGESLPSFVLSYCTFGQLNKDKSNVVWVCHPLTADAQVNQWWSGLFGEGKCFNPEKDFVVCANMLGSCYGSTGATSINPEKGEPYFHDFPKLSIRDQCRAFDLLRQHLNLPHIKLLIGCSMGGQQALEWAAGKPFLCEQMVLIASNARQSPWGVAFNETQRMAIAADKSWQERKKTAGKDGLKAARAIAMLSYRGYQTYQKSQQETTNKKLSGFRAGSYQQYQGEKLANRFNAFAYWTLSHTMDSHCVGRARKSCQAALRKILAKTLVIGIESDLLFPTHEQKFMAQNIPDANYAEFYSDYGHDGFLVETDQIAEIISGFLADNVAEKQSAQTGFALAL